MTSTRPAMILDDPWLEPYESEIRARIERFQTRANQRIREHGSLRDYASTHLEQGLHRNPRGWTYREWAPRAQGLSLIGDFNGWDPNAHPLRPEEHGTWAVEIPNGPDGKTRLEHGQRYKVRVLGENGVHDRIPPLVRRAVQDPVTKDFAGQVWCPPQPFAWTDSGFATRPGQAPLVYEAHVGMAQEEQGVGTYLEFADRILPRIVTAGYDTVQLMAVAEHPYYGSFGYHVANFFAPSSRFGTPEELKELIDRAHGLGLAVWLDLVHSHSVKNFHEGLAEFDGSDGLYFHTGSRGWHPDWDSRLFDYGRPEVERFLLSNLRYWMEDFHIDGFRFDGVTSMLYFHHGNIDFDHYDHYFRDHLEWDATTYLQLANKLVHELRHGAVTVAEDMSGMPGLCRPTEDGGLGFDYRLAMGLPDHWTNLLKNCRDEDWSMQELFDVLSNRRGKEKTIAYVESHDQALVGDKTTAFWLMDEKMYWHMSREDEHPVIERGIALHKMIRLATLAAGGEGWLNFIGNEFGHPEWVDFPREENDWSYLYARRQWHLVDDPALRYGQLGSFDAALLKLARDRNWLASEPACLLNVDQDNSCLIFERGGLIVALNFHPEKSIPDYRFISQNHGDFELALSTDETECGGFGRATAGSRHSHIADELSIYLPSRTGLVYRPMA